PESGPDSAAVPADCAKNSRSDVAALGVADERAGGLGVVAALSLDRGGAFFKSAAPSPFPFDEASEPAVAPELSASAGSAPARNKNSTISLFPVLAASISGVRPSSALESIS